MSASEIRDWIISIIFGVVVLLVRYLVVFLKKSVLEAREHVVEQARVISYIKTAVDGQRGDLLRDLMIRDRTIYELSTDPEDKAIAEGVMKMSQKMYENHLETCKVVDVANQAFSQGVALQKAKQDSQQLATPGVDPVVFPIKKTIMTPEVPPIVVNVPKVDLRGLPGK